MAAAHSVNDYERLQEIGKGKYQGLRVLSIRKLWFCLQGEKKVRWKDARMEGT